MSTVLPKRKVRIFGRTISLKALYHILIAAMISVALCLPWVVIKAVFTPKIRINAVEGWLAFVVYGFGEVSLGYDIVNVESKEKVILENIHQVEGISSIPLIFGALMAGTIAINIVLFINEIKPVIEKKISDILEFSYVALLTGTVLLYPVVILFSSSLIPGKLIGDMYIFIYRGSLEISKTYPQTRISYEFAPGAGYLISLLLFILVISFYIYDKILASKWDLSRYWTIRALLALHMTLSALAPLMIYVVSEEHGILREGIYVVSFAWTLWYNNGTVALKNASFLAYLLMILSISILFLIALAATRLDARHIMKKTPFITLALPEDEIIRRHKMLPMITKSARTVDLLITLLSFFGVIIMVVLFIMTYGILAMEIETKYAIGLFWTTPFATVFTLSIILEFLMYLIPIGRT